MASRQPEPEKNEADYYWLLSRLHGPAAPCRQPESPVSRSGRHDRRTDETSMYKKGIGRSDNLNLSSARHGRDGPSSQFHCDAHSSQSDLRPPADHAHSRNPSSASAAVCGRVMGRDRDWHHAIQAVLSKRRYARPPLDTTRTLPPNHACPPVTCVVGQLPRRIACWALRRRHRLLPEVPVRRRQAAVPRPHRRFRDLDGAGEKPEKL